MPSLARAARKVFCTALRSIRFGSVAVLKLMNKASDPLSFRPNIRSRYENRIVPKIQKGTSVQQNIAPSNPGANNHVQFKPVEFCRYDAEQLGRPAKYNGVGVGKFYG
jgi:hypothetical protein